ncbi:MAG: hypothetical protein ACFFDY_14265 [Candidatus Thorarchaeota archaeon]
MEFNLHALSAFQIYSTGLRDQINIMADRLWMKDNRIFFRVVEELLPNKIYFRKERGTNIFFNYKRKFFEYSLQVIFLSNLLQILLN